MIKDIAYYEKQIANFERMLINGVDDAAAALEKAVEHLKELLALAAKHVPGWDGK